MVTHVVPDAEVGAAAHVPATPDLPSRKGRRAALNYIKRNINNAESLSLEAYFDREAIHHSRAVRTADRKEAAKAFVEKRKAGCFSRIDDFLLHLSTIGATVSPHLVRAEVKQ